MFSRLINICFIFFVVSCNKAKQADEPIINTSKTVILYSWKEYTSLNVLKQFELETGIKVVLKEFDTIEEQLANLRANPEFCDLTIFDSHMAKDQFIGIKLIKKLDTQKLKNIDKYTKHFQEFKEIGVPYSYGATGFAIDTKQVTKEYTDYSFLYEPQFKGKVAILDDPVDYFLASLTAVKFDYRARNVFTDDIIKNINTFTDKLIANEPRINETFSNLDDLVSGKIAIAHTYSGDCASYQQENPHIKFLIPQNGFNAWSESICLTTNAPNETNAYKLLNYLSTHKAAAEFSNEFYYANGIQGSEKYMTKEIRENPLVNMSEQDRNKARYYLKSKEDNALTQQLFAKFKVGIKNEE
ncbi:MAG: extracellular solute-binding protein [Lentisphaeraceae bacterium]|nr:extracellular solute-binding protein [Lentisphaeraceae bacterium]